MTALRIEIVDPYGARAVSAIVDEARAPRGIVTLAHGAGADMHHRFLVDIAARLVEGGITCVRHQFPYTERGSRRIDAKPVLLATIRAVAEHVRTQWPALPLVVAGKSMGGRMATLAAAEAPLRGVRGLVLLGFPLHPRGKVSTERALHLPRVGVPTLFLHGTRDALGSVERLQGVLPPGARLQVIEHADHGFDVLRRSGRTRADIAAELALAIAGFVAERAGAAG